MHFNNLTTKYVCCLQCCQREDFVSKCRSSTSSNKPYDRIYSNKHMAQHNLWQRKNVLSKASLHKMAICYCNGSINPANRKIELKINRNYSYFINHTKVNPLGTHIYVYMCIRVETMGREKPFPPFGCVKLNAECGSYLFFFCCRHVQSLTLGTTLNTSSLKVCWSFFS